MILQEPMDLLTFQKKFRSEADCQRYLFETRWPDGFCCPKCQSSDYSFVSTRNLYQCKHCRHQASVTSGTIMHKTRISLLVWFWIIYIISHDKRGISAKQIATEFSLFYSTAWTILHKIRKAMSDRDAVYKLTDIVEMDDAYFGAPKEGGKRGRGTDKAQVMIGLSLSPQGYPKFVKMCVISNIKKETVLTFAKNNIKKGSTIDSDAYSSFKSLDTNGYTLNAMKFDAKNNPDHLNWIHTVISNAKAFIAGTFHGLDKKNLQRYLDEFCYRMNRRHYKGDKFTRLLFACSNTDTITYDELIGDGSLS